ncbi:LysE family translocator [Denitrobaculum tricleocarpae]|uniref:LysE family translocator n=1 Tax=Denitrobaculum tricleocarpae TaxID=2591009 RepID=A0A545U340_9PROT|nr:LysE family translocator [Denitrobaculum tricleocarpae]
MIMLFFQGLLLGLSVAAPVGPIGVLCIRRSLSQGMGVGFASGLGAAVADAFYGAVAAFGLTAISSFLIEIEGALLLGGGLFLLWLGVKTFRAVPAPLGSGGQNGGAASAFLSCVVLTLANPATIFSFVALFSGLGFAGSSTAQAHGYGGAVILVAGVFLGSALWWLGLSGSVGLFRNRMTSHALKRINQLSGSILTVFGLAALMRFVWPDI